MLKSRLRLFYLPLLLCISLSIVFFVVTVATSTDTHAEETQDAGIKADFARLVNRLLETADVEERIVITERALRLESELREWPLKGSREELKFALLGGLADSYMERREGERADNLEKAITAYEAALTALPRDALPERWAHVQSNLGVAYQRRIRGQRDENFERAIKAYEAALSIYTHEAFPRDWALTQNNLGQAFADRSQGEQANNFELAIDAFGAALTVWTRENAPQYWAEAQRNIGTVYQNRIRGDRADNLERAIQAYEAALTFWTRRVSARDWAETQSELASAYANRIHGEHADNIEQAIRAYEAALTVYTRDASPRQWAEVQTKLAKLYGEHIRGERPDNIERAIKTFEATLTVYTREAYPELWAEAQANLAKTYVIRIQGARAENLERAIKLYKAALTVLTPDAFPEISAEIKKELRIVYQKARPEVPEARLNLQRDIEQITACYRLPVDFNCVAIFTDPEALKASGGTKGLVDDALEADRAMSSTGYVVNWPEFRIVETGNLVTLNGLLFARLKSQVPISVRGRNGILVGTSIAISRDRGNTWRFVEATQSSKPFLDANFPGIWDQLAPPEPEFLPGE